MHEDKFWESFSKGADVWNIVVVVLVISLILFIVLRIATRAVADRRTRKILIEGMREDEGESASDPGGSPEKDSRPAR